MPCLARVHRVEEVLDPQQSWASRDDLDAFARRLVSLLARVGHLACPSSCDSGPLAGFVLFQDYLGGLRNHEPNR